MYLYGERYIGCDQIVADRIKSSTPRGAIGASLIEVCVAMALSTIVLYGVFQWYQVLKKGAIEHSVKKQILSIGRIAFQFLMRDVNASGYLGCRTLDSNFPLNKVFVDYGNVSKFFRTDRSIFGFDNSPGVCRTYLPASTCERIKEGGHALIIYNVPAGWSRLKQDMKDPEDAIWLKNPVRITKDSVVLIEDCLAGDLFVANDIQGGKVFHQKSPRANQSDSFSKIYKKNTEVTELQTIAYYLGVPVRKKEAKEPYSFSLYRDNLLQDAQEIIEDIVDFEVDYSLRMPSGELVYNKALNILDREWQWAQGMRIKVTTQPSHVWEYDFAIRNRRRVRCNLDIVNRNLGSGVAHDE